MKKTLAALVVLMLPQVALAQKTAGQSEAVEITTKIEAIDYNKRRVTLKHEDGELETVRCGPDVKRFNELKVGDTVTFRYQESIAYSIRKPGQPSGLPADTGRALTPGQGPRPGGTVAAQETATVTVKAIDQKVPSITVTTEDGRTLSFKVDDKKKLQGLAAGDKVEVTYTEAVMISVK